MTLVNYFDIFRANFHFLISKYNFIETFKYKREPMTIFLLKIFFGFLSISFLIVGIKLFLLPILKKKNTFYKTHALNIIHHDSKHMENHKPLNINYTKGLGVFHSKEPLEYEFKIQSRPHEKGWAH